MTDEHPCPPGKWHCDLDDTCYPENAFRLFSQFGITHGLEHVTEGKQPRHLDDGRMIVMPTFTDDPAHD